MANGASPELEKKYTRLNNILGWLVFLIAVVVYWATVESGNSFWDCSENISIYYKLEIGHSPGEPFLQLIQHLVSLLSFGNVHNVAPLINHAAATFSAMAILFLFWTITYFGRRMADKIGGLTEANMWAILGSGIVGAGGFIFADSMWFSANEASVWAASIGFTALMFWCVTKWERSTTRPENWLILIFFLTGLSIGVHLLCLLFIPAGVFVYYNKKYPNGLNKSYWLKIFGWLTKSPKKIGAIVALFAAVLMLYIIKNLVIPGIVDFGFYFELFFVNVFHLPFNSGIFIYGAVLLGAIIWGLNFTKKLNKPVVNTVILSFAALLLGYSCYFLVVVRAAAAPPLNEGNPSNPISLHSYLDREQYGEWPVLYGQYYAAPLIDAKQGAPVYEKDKKQNDYVVASHKQIPVYEPKLCGYFPRMWASDKAAGYRTWGNGENDKVAINEGGNTQMLDKPTFSNNMHYFFHYQIYAMYIRYFLWDFVGRQNDVQCMAPQDILHGNWITGIPFIDALIGPPQDNMPSDLKDNKARAPMYGLPFLLGLLGMYFQYKKDRKDALTIAVFFLFAGLAIVLYLNQWAPQPRERDYSYVTSFYAFAIWMGLGVMGLFSFITDRMAKSNTSPKTIAMGVVVFSLIVPVVMAKAEWPAHDRHDHYVAEATAIDYLQSCAPNAILFTDGDNDTFPLWYAQEVLGIRTDVRICNLELLGMGWYADMMAKQQYKSAPMPFSLTHDEYNKSSMDYLYYYNRNIKGYIPLGQVIDFIKSNNPADKITMNDGSMVNYFPTHNFSLAVNKQNVLNSGAIPAKYRDSIPSEIDWTLPGSGVQRNDIMALDAIAHNDWKRPIYFAVSLPSYMGLDKYMQLEGLAYRLVPIKGNGVNTMDPMINTDIMYDNMMHKFTWGNMGKGIYIDDTFRRTIAGDLRMQTSLLAQALIEQNKTDSAVKVMNLCMDSIPAKTAPFDYWSFQLVEQYYETKDFKQANMYALQIFNQFESDLRYYRTLDKEYQAFYERDIEEFEGILERLQLLAEQSKQTDLANQLKNRVDAMVKTGIIDQQVR